MTSVIIGAKRLEQLEDNLGATEVRLSDADRERLDCINALLPEHSDGYLRRYSTNKTNSVDGGGVVVIK